jgi:hypothetical protein
MTSPAYPVAAYGPVVPIAYVPRPTAAWALSLVGGTLILLGGVSEILLGITLAGIVGFSGWTILLGFVGVGLGAVVVTFGALLYLHPARHVAYGVVVVVASSLSVVAYWGFVVGLVVGLIGGILAMTWVPTTPFGWAYGPATPGATIPGLPPPSPVARACLKCGFLTARDSRFCPQCGSPLAVA